MAPSQDSPERSQIRGRNHATKPTGSRAASSTSWSTRRTWGGTHTWSRSRKAAPWCGRPRASEGCQERRSGPWPRHGSGGPTPCVGEKETDSETRPTWRCLSLRVHGQCPTEGPVHTPYGGYRHTAFPQGYGRQAKDPHVHSSDSLPLNQPGEPSWSPSSLYKPGCRGRATGPVPAWKSRFPECFGCSSSHRRSTQDGRAESGFGQDRRFESHSAPPFPSWPEGGGRDVQVSPRAALFQAWSSHCPPSEPAA